MSIKLVQLAANLTKVDTGDISIYFSYETPVAFEDNRTYELAISENVWSNTTGKHLNSLNPNKDLRIPREEFEARLDAALAN